MNKSNKIIFGCLGSLILMALVSWAAIIWVKNKTISFVAESTNQVLKTEINDSSLPKQQKEALLILADDILQAITDGEIGFGLDGSLTDPQKATKIAVASFKKSFAKIEPDPDQQLIFNQQLDRLRESYLAGDITATEAEAMVSKLAKGPFGIKFTAWAIHLCYIIPSGLTQEEKVQAESTLARMVDGLNSDIIQKEEIESISAPYQRTREDGKKFLKNDLTDTEMKSLLMAITELLEQKDVPLESKTLKIAEELKIALDKAGLN